MSCECIRARSRLQGKLVWTYGFVKHGRPLLGERGGDEAAKGVVCHGAPHTRTSRIKGGGITEQVHCLCILEWKLHVLCPHALQARGAPALCLAQRRGHRSSCELDRALPFVAGVGERGCGKRRSGSVSVRRVASDGLRAKRELRRSQRLAGRESSP